MSIDEFNKTGFGGGMRCRYMKRIYDIASVNFPEALLALKDNDDEPEDYMWVRCENIELV